MVFADSGSNLLGDSGFGGAGSGAGRVVAQAGKLGLAGFNVLSFAVVGRSKLTAFELSNWPVLN